MWKLFKVLGFIFNWLCPFGVVYINHVAYVSAGYDTDMLGLLMVVVLLISLLKWIDNKCKVWEIQDRHKMFRLNWSSFKKIVLIGLIAWGSYTIEDSLPKIQWTLVLITSCFVVGWFFSFIGNIKKNKAV